MTQHPKMHRGLALRGYLAASHGLALAARPILKRRLSRGKEHPTRWPEKLGNDLAPRPSGRLIWLHAVGLGEVLSLRGLIARLAAADPDLSFLVTSTTRASADVLSTQMPPRTLHQFLPIDAPAFRRRFVDHFAPDLCIWVEQDLWPGFVSDLDKRSIPQCMVAARMNDAAFRRHEKARGLFADLYRAMAFITAQDNATARHLSALGAMVTVSGSLKPAAPPLDVAADQLADFQVHLAGRFVWAVSPAHPDDAQIAQDAHEMVLAQRPDALLIIAPRFPETFEKGALPRQSRGTFPQPDDQIWLCDTLGDLGLVYRLTQAVLIGGTFSDIAGHNPWEAAVLENAILHGPQTANFVADFAQLDEAGASVKVGNAIEVARALTSADVTQRGQDAKDCVADIAAETDKVVTQIMAQLGKV